MKTRGVWQSGVSTDGLPRFVASYNWHGKQLQKMFSGKDAEARASEFRRKTEKSKLLGVNPVDAPERRTIGQVVSEYLTEGCDEDKRQGYASLAHGLADVAGDMPVSNLSDVTARKIREQLKSRGDRRLGAKDKSGRRRLSGRPITEDRITKHFTLLRAACRFGKCAAFFAGMSKQDRARVFKVEKDPTREFERFSDEQFERIVAELEEGFAPGARLALETGMRLDEVYGLAWSEVRGADVHLPASRTKSGRPEIVTLGSKARALLPPRGEGLVFRGPNGGELRTRASHAWADAATRAKLPKIRFHDIRHEWASRFVERGGTLVELKEAGRWRSLAMVQRYATASRDRIREVLDRPISLTH